MISKYKSKYSEKSFNITKEDKVLTKKGFIYIFRLI